MHTPMFAEPLVAAALEAAAEDAATEDAAVEVLEEPPQAVIAAVAPTTADAFRKSRREIIFIIVFSFNSYLSIFTGAFLHVPVIPVRIIPLQSPLCKRTSSQDRRSSFVLFQQMLFGLANFFSRNITIFHTFATFLQRQKNYVIFLSKRLQNVAWSPLGTPCISCIS